MTERAVALNSAVGISVISVIWSGAVGAVAVIGAAGSGSLSMLGFGVDAVIDAAASVALIWRFLGEARQPARAAQVERAAEVIVGCALVALAAYLAIASIRSLFGGQSPIASEVAVAILVASVALLPPIAVLKRRIAGRLKSGALHADSVLTLVAAVLAAVSLAGLGLTAGFGWWWADALAALFVAAVVAREGASALSLGR